MDIKKHLNSTKIYQEFDDENQKYWFDFKQKKFLHNIDTFYYSVKLLEDFTDDSKDDSVLKLRQFFDKKKSLLASRHGESVPVYFSGCDRSLNLRSGTFAGFFNICLENPEWFDIFIAPVVLMVVYQLLVRSWFRSVLTCYGCTEFMRVLNAPIIL